MEATYTVHTSEGNICRQSPEAALRAYAMTIQPATIILKPGQQGTYAGFPATVVRHYDGNMYEIRVPGGVTCVAAEYFIPA